MNLPQLFKTLSDPVRLRILNLLLDKEELCVCDIMDTLELPQSLVSRHLAYLRKHELVASQRKGNWQYYHQTLSQKNKQAVATFTQHLRAMLSEEEIMQEDLVRLNEQTNPCCV